jgi:hypothetical protein
MIVMETNSAKILDEACNCFNEVYRDEVLYTAWIERLRSGSVKAGTTPSSSAAGVSVRLYARQE